MSTFKDDNQFRLDAMHLPGITIPKIKPSAHFLQRWQERVCLDSAYFRTQMLEGRYMYVATVGVDSHHILIKIKKKFYILIVANDGVLQTILDEKMYQHQIRAANLSGQKIAFYTKFPTSNHFRCLAVGYKNKYEKLKNGDYGKLLHDYENIKKQFKEQREVCRTDKRRAVNIAVSESPKFQELEKKYNIAIKECIKLRSENQQLKENK